MLSPRSKPTSDSMVAASRPGAGPNLVIVRPSRPNDLLAVARAEGRVNRPPSGSEHLCEFEELIVGEHTRQHVASVEQARGRVREFEANGRGLLEGLPTPRELVAVVEGARAALNRELSDRRALVDERTALQQGSRDLRHFKCERGIERPANYPTSRRLHLAGVVVLTTLEAVVNATFFAGGNSFGLLGGLAVAAVLAAFNTITGVLAGYYCLRGLNHHRPFVRKLCGLGIAAYAVIAVLFNLAAGRARDMADSGVVTPERFFTLLRHPFDLTLLSVALVGIGLVSVLLAVVKGRSLSDAIPGYRRLDERARAAEEAFAEAAGAVRGRVLQHVEAIPIQVHGLVRRAEQAVEQIEGAVVSAGKAREGYEADRQHLATACQGLLRRVRDENTRVRTTPPPRHFGEYPVFGNPLDAPSTERLASYLQQAIAQIGELKAEAHRINSDQAARIADATKRFNEFHEAQVRRADGENGGAQ